MKYALQLTALILVSLGLQAQIPTNGLIGGWPFTGNANDMSGNNNHGTVNGAILTNDRFSSANCAYKFNGTSDYIVMQNGGPLGSVARSVSFWSHTTSSTHMSCFDYGASNANGGAWQIAMNYCAPGIGVDVSDQALIRDNNSLANEAWHHIVAILDPNAGTQINQLIFYVDGVLQPNIACSVTGTTAVMNTASGNPITIGRDAVSFGVRFFSGDLDDFYFYNRALTQAEVLQLFNDNPNTTGLASSSPESTLQVYPNPATTTISVDLPNDGLYTYTLVDLLGQEIKSGKLRQGTLLHLDDLAKGAYLIRVRDGSAKVVGTTKVLLTD